MPLYRQAVSDSATTNEATLAARTMPAEAMSALEAAFCGWLRHRYGSPGIDFVAGGPTKGADAVLTVAPAGKVVGSLAA